MAGGGKRLRARLRKQRLQSGNASASSSQALVIPARRSSLGRFRARQFLHALRFRLADSSSLSFCAVSSSFLSAFAYQSVFLGVCIRILGWDCLVAAAQAWSDVEFMSLFSGSFQAEMQFAGLLKVLQDMFSIPMTCTFSFACDTGPFFRSLASALGVRRCC